MIQREISGFRLEDIGLQFRSNALVTVSWSVFRVTKNCLDGIDPGQRKTLQNSFVDVVEKRAPRGCRNSNQQSPDPQISRLEVNLRRDLTCKDS